MKKFLAVLALVFCMALPASAATTWTVKNCTASNDTDIYYAVANADDGDTIVVEKSIALSSHYHGVSDDIGLLISSDKTLTLQINEGCTLSASNLNTDGTVCILVNGGNLTITGKGTILAEKSTYAAGIVAFSSTVRIEDNVIITAKGTERSKSVGVGASGELSNVRIFGGTVNGNLDASGYATITVYDAAVSGDLKVGTEGSDSDCAAINLYDVTLNGTVEDHDPHANIGFGPDSGYTGSPGNYVVTNNAKITFAPESIIEVTHGETKTEVVSVDLYASDDVKQLPITELEVVSTPVKGIDVTPSSSDGTIKFKVNSNCAAGTYKFKVFCSDLFNNSPHHAKIETFTVKVNGNSSSSGCNAGFGALALAALAVMTVVRRRKK